VPTSLRSRLLWKIALPAACLLAGAVGGYLFRDVRVPRVLAAATEMREGGYRYVNPLLECDRGADVIQSEELHSFRARVVEHLATLQYPGVEDVSVYFRELNDGLWFSIGDEGRYAPASLRKIPMMIAALKQADRAPELLLRRVRFDLGQDYTRQQNFKPSVQLVRGEEYTIAELIRRMIVYSDNNAYMLLARVIDPAELDRTYAKLDVRSAAGEGPRDFLTVYTYASFFRALFNANYLGKQLSEFALEQLANSEFRSGIVAGVPRGVPVAHKFGEALEDARGTRVQLHDCGIVYAPERPYLLCIMSRGSKFEYLDDAIASTSRVIFEAVLTEHQHASR
jgi:beta-lactamase class A